MLATPNTLTLFPFVDLCRNFRSKRQSFLAR